MILPLIFLRMVRAFFMEVGLPILVLPTVMKVSAPMMMASALEFVGRDFLKRVLRGECLLVGDSFWLCEADFCACFCNCSATAWAFPQLKSVANSRGFWLACMSSW